MKDLIKLYSAWFRIGLFTYGGGYAMLPMIQREIVEKYKWATNDEILDYYAIGQCTPGVIAVNTATFVGYNYKGKLGAIAATLGVISPSILVITIIATFISNFAEIEIVKHALNGISVAICVLLTKSLFNLFKGSIKTVFAAIIATIAFILVFFVKVPTVYVVIGAGIIGVIYGKGGNR